MLLLIAQCNRSLGLLHKANGNVGLACDYLTEAVHVFRDMEMDGWIGRSEQTLAEVSA